VATLQFKYYTSFSHVSWLSSLASTWAYPYLLKKLSREHLQPIIDSIADQLPGWKADLTTRAGRKIHVQFVLTSKMVYPATTIDFSQCAHKLVDKIRRGYL
jgi:hypothetical protein